MNRVDATRPDSPILAGPGPYQVGVTHRVITDPERLNLDSGQITPRALPTEIWYPAHTNTHPGGQYHTLLRDGVTPTVLHGRAARDAEPAPDGPFPLVVLSHGYPGNRFLMSHLAEALASRGFVVAAPDHALSTYDDLGPFGATLYHRPLDQRVLLSAFDEDPRVDASRAALIGYSMGSYGALVTAGAGLAPGIETHELAPTNGRLACHVAGQNAPAPANLRAVVTIGPWGMANGLWTAQTLAELRVPLMIMAGSVDEVSNYAGMREIAALATGCDRALLTFDNAGHNAAAPIPAPKESHAFSEVLGWAPFAHYADPVWDTVRMNAIAQHFAAAFLGAHLKDDSGCEPLIQPETAFDSAAGFSPETQVGLRFETWAAGDKG